MLFFRSKSSVASIRTRGSRLKKFGIGKIKDFDALGKTPKTPIRRGDAKAIAEDVRARIRKLMREGKL
jgi:hypothetical protein